MIKKVTVLGSTGSIGKQTLEVIAAHPNEFSLYGLSANSSGELLIEQAQKYGAQRIACTKEINVPAEIDALFGSDAAERLAADSAADIVVLAISGIAALRPLLSAIKNGKRIAIANKESLVCGGDLVKDELEKHHAELIPIDSEQSAIFQCLKNGSSSEVKRLILTASGGPFFNRSLDELKNVSMAEVLRHPTWNMGRKITLDSATLFNKGLEIIEAARLFNRTADEISVLIHPQSIVHSMVEYCDGTVMANMSCPDMRLPIQYALSYPQRLPSPASPLKLEDVGQLTFHKADLTRFRAISLAYDALRLGGGYPVVYNGANERAAELYFAGKIDFLDIIDCVAYSCDRYKNCSMDSVDAVFNADCQSRKLAEEFAEHRKG